MKNKITLLFVFLFGNLLLAQSKPLCGDLALKYQLEKLYPGASHVVNQTFKNAKKSTRTRADILRIPVVFHVIYNNDDQNLSDDLIKSQIDVLNEDFRRLNSNAVDTRSIFEEIAVDAEIEFFIAGIDPEGNPTSGITRTFTENSSFINISIIDLIEAFTECGTDFTDPNVLSCIEELLGESNNIDLDAMKSSASGGKDPWDTNKYLNIWIVNLGLETQGQDPIPFVLGFAYPPMEAPNWPADVFPQDLENKDGVVLHYQTVGRNNPFAGILEGTNDQGRTCVHEVGHYLGLRHIWGDGDCNDDDGITDTPQAASESTATADVDVCSDLHSKDSCIDDSLPDMIENYMDYSLERCQNMFTSEQVSLMRAMLEGPRSGLLENQISSYISINLPNYLIYPNPSFGDINVIIDNDQLKTIRVFDVSGNHVLETQKTSFQLNHLKVGIYFIEIIANNTSYLEKIIITK